MRRIDPLLSTDPEVANLLKTEAPQGPVMPELPALRPRGEVDVAQMMKYLMTKSRPRQGNPEQDQIMRFLEAAFERLSRSV